ncbi:G-type lectin S-receptor-like serine/threonine-protein kinase SD2-5 [Selaginella moellendorffii]|nr:G-type lectin S-receptor-like serine/threonine-protein kinase SD2-5 [Selaginella moellendorffii]|eukprot:XP_024514869.1 G-type lectin S-receptor-like serine/threonine-protein kinase SD2-5 [Selaginella moellendorffii]
MIHRLVLGYRIIYQRRHLALPASKHLVKHIAGTCLTPVAMPWAARRLKLFVSDKLEPTKSIHGTDAGILTGMFDAPIELLLVILLCFCPSCKCLLDIGFPGNPEIAVDSNFNWTLNGDLHPFLCQNLSKRAFAAGFTSSKTGLFYLAVYYVKAGGENHTSAVWKANNGRPVPLGASLKLQVDGNLVLYNPDGTESWSTKTSGLGVAGMRLNQTGNLVLYREDDQVVWQSFDHPTDTLVPHQLIKTGMKLVSSSPGGTGEGYFSFEVQPYALVLSAQSPLQRYGVWKFDQEIGFVGVNFSSFNVYNRKMTVIQSVALSIVYSVRRIQLFSTGEVVADIDWDILDLTKFFNGWIGWDLSYPGVCGRYSMTREGECHCIGLKSDKGTQTYLEPVDSLDGTLGCRLSHEGDLAMEYRLVAGDKFYDYLPLKFMQGAILSQADCLETCLTNSSCKAVLFEDNNRTCFHLTEVYTLNVTRAPAFSAFIKVKTGTSKLVVRNANHSKTGVLITAVLGIAALTVTVIVSAVAYWKNKVDFYFKSRRQSSQAIVSGAAQAPRPFNLRELEMATRNFSKRIGSGGFGTVFEGSLSDGSRIAVKLLDDSNQGEKQFKAEVRAICNIHHRNLVTLRGYCSQKPHHFLVYDYVHNGSLDRWLFDSSKAKSLDWNRRFSIVQDIARGLAYLHEECSSTVLHLDIKPQNVLLDESFTAKISDFGLSRILGGDGRTDNAVTAIKGTPGYMAPEWLTQTKVTKALDVYSFGIVVLEIITGLSAVDERMSRKNVSSTLEVVIDQGMDRTKRSKIERLIQIGLWCTKVEQSQRPSMVEVVKVLEI